MKNRKKVNIDKVEISLDIEHFSSIPKNQEKRRFFRGPAPHEYVRKLIYQLQIYADKHEMGRFEHETVREWFQRLGFINHEDLLLAYEDVRYGNVVISKSEANHFEGVIADLKREIKQQTKIENDREV
jgi:hypothetical protein